MNFSNNYKIKIPNLLILRKSFSILKTTDIITAKSYYLEQPFNPYQDFYDGLNVGDLDIGDSLVGDYDISLTDRLDNNILEYLLYDVEGNDFIIDDNDILEPTLFLMNDNGGNDFVLSDVVGSFLIEDK